MKKIVVFLSICCLLIALYFIFLSKEVKEETKVPTTYPMVKTDAIIERFILHHLMMDNGVIRTNFADKQAGRVFLSESLGLWMEYLVLKKDEEQFDYAFHTMKNVYQLDNDLLSWQIVDEKQATTNALIDDLRIIEALFQMGEATNNQAYLDEAIRISQAIVQSQVLEHYLVDFYDAEYKTHNDFLTLSYINMEAIYFMEKYKVIDSSMVEKMKVLLKELPMKDNFYAQTFQIQSHTFTFEEEINLIDQLYIALHLEGAGMDTVTFNDWLQMEFYQNHHLYGRYDAETKRHTVGYESVAVYALAVLYGIERDDYPFATSVYEQMLTLQDREEDSPYFGGFLAEGSKETHSFDNLLALLAERKLLNGQISGQ